MHGSPVTKCNLPGDTAAALALAESFDQSIESGDAHLIAGILALVYAELGKPDEAMRWLTKAVANYDSMVIYLFEESFDSLRGDPRFAALIRELGLPEDVYLEQPAPTKN